MGTRGGDVRLEGRCEGAGGCRLKLWKRLECATRWSEKSE
jgi:hypothetical protein